MNNEKVSFFRKPLTVLKYSDLGTVLRNESITCNYISRARLISSSFESIQGIGKFISLQQNTENYGGFFIIFCYKNIITSNIYFSMSFYVAV
jgi:hypothetical protein